MTDKPFIALLDDKSTMQQCGNGAKVISFTLDILGSKERFRISVAKRQTRLMDLVPLARALSNKIITVVTKRLNAERERIPCRKGCSACCSYLVPLSIPEAFYLYEEILTIPRQFNGVIMRLCLDKAKKILEYIRIDFGIDELLEVNERSKMSELSSWYSGLTIACPFLSDGICSIYKQRPLACREHIVTESAKFCNPSWGERSRTVLIPVSVLECLGKLAAELDGSEVNALMLPLALPWAKENIKLSKRTWPAVMMVERFAEILKEAASKNAGKKAAITAGVIH